MERPSTASVSSDCHLQKLSEYYEALKSGLLEVQCITDSDNKRRRVKSTFDTYLIPFMMAVKSAQFQYIYLSIKKNPLIPITQVIVTENHDQTALWIDIEGVSAANNQYTCYSFTTVNQGASPLSQYCERVLEYAHADLPFVCADSEKLLNINFETHNLDIARLQCTLLYVETITFLYYPIAEKTQCKIPMHGAVCALSWGSRELHFIRTSNVVSQVEKIKHTLHLIPISCK